MVIRVCYLRAAKCHIKTLLGRFQIVGMALLLGGMYLMGRP
jgi:hypothetical protein